jgi:hypothetical protein
MYGAPDRNRTCNHQLRRLVLYPLSYGRQRTPAHYIPSITRVQLKMVGVEGFEPPTPCSQSRCATRLRYTPIGASTPVSAGTSRYWEPLPWRLTRAARGRNYTHHPRDRQSGVTVIIGSISADTTLGVLPGRVR